MDTKWNKIIERLPHGPEFRFVDEILNLEPGRFVSARRALRAEEPYFQGHFPGAPLFPGVLMIEAMAQAAGLAAEIKEGQTLLLTAVKLVKMYQSVKPGLEIFIEAEIVMQTEDMVQASGRVMDVEKKLLAEGQIVLSIKRNDLIVNN